MVISSGWKTDGGMVSCDSCLSEAIFSQPVRYGMVFPIGTQRATKRNDGCKTGEKRLVRVIF